MSVDDVVQQAQRDGVRLVRFLYCDNGGLIRGKAAWIGVLASRLESGIGLTPAMQVMNMFDQLQPREDLGLGAVGEVRLTPDPDTYRRLPHAPQSGQVCCDLLTLDRTPWGACPRSFLKRQIARAAARGLRIMASFENEWMVLRETAGGFTPVGEQVYASTVAFNETEAMTQDLLQGLVQAGIEVEQYYPEYGDGQHEATMAPAGALAAADNQVIFREVVKGIYARHGAIATFAPKPFTDEVGNGAHLHLSLWNSDSSRNLTYDPDDRFGTSRLAYQFIAGIIGHLPALTALTSPTHNSYRRLTPSAWASAYTCYGYDNREATVRIQSTYWGRESSSANLEVRTADGSCNPYLALGAVIAAGLDGIERELDPGEPVTVDPARLPEAERQQRGIHRLPASLAESLDALERDDVLRGALGHLMYESFATVKRSEYNWCKDQEFAVEQRHHVLKF